MAPQVLYMGILRNDPSPAVELAVEKELSSFSRFTRANYSEFMTMFAKTIAERTKPGIRQDVEEKQYTFHAYATSQGLCGIIISDPSYPKLAAHALLSKMVDEFRSAHPHSEYSGAKVGTLDYPQLKEHIVKYQNPDEADSIAKIQKDLDQTMDILRKTIDSVLERGEKLDSLVQKSDGLSAQSKMFYGQAKKQNSCCIVM